MGGDSGSPKEAVVTGGGGSGQQQHGGGPGSPMATVQVGSDHRIMACHGWEGRARGHKRAASGCVGGFRWGWRQDGGGTWEEGGIKGGGRKEAREE